MSCDSKARRVGQSQRHALRVLALRVGLSAVRIQYPTVAAEVGDRLHVGLLDHIQLRRASLDVACSLALIASIFSTSELFLLNEILNLFGMCGAFMAHSNWQLALHSIGDPSLVELSILVHRHFDCQLFAIRGCGL